MKSFVQNQIKYSPKFAQNIFNRCSQFWNGSLKFVTVKNEHMQFLGNLKILILNKDLASDIKLEKPFLRVLESDLVKKQETIDAQRPNIDKTKIYIPGYRVDIPNLLNLKQHEQDLDQYNIYLCQKTQKVFIALQDQQAQQDQEDKGYIKVGYIKNQELSKIIFEKEDMVLITKLGNYKFYFFNNLFKLMVILGGLQTVYIMNFMEQGELFSPLINKKEIHDQVFQGISVQKEDQINKENQEQNSDNK